MLLRTENCTRPEGIRFDMEYALHAGASNNARDAHCEVIDAIFSLQQCPDGESSLFIDHDRADDTADRRGDAMVGVSLFYENFRAEAPDRIEDFILVDQGQAVCPTKISTSTPQTFAILQGTNPVGL
jgi:hypothetical protein